MAGIGICVNPLAGRDVRRLAARASTETFEAKRDAVARVAAGADAVGAAHLFVADEPFRIASAALKWMPLKARVHVLKTPVGHDAGDTEAAIAAFLERGATTIVSLGGDGTNRAIARAATDIDLVPLSTGTNNVFPALAEPTLAGVAAGLTARGAFGDRAWPRCKLLHVSLAGGARDVAVIDAALLADDFIGNMRPFDAAKLRRILLTRAEPDAVGTSPIGGYLEVVEAADDHGLLVSLGAGRTVTAPLSPGLFRSVRVAAAERVPFEAPIEFRGDGVLALDGDREHRLSPSRPATVVVRRNGPRVVDVAAALREAARRGLLA